MLYGIHRTIELNKEIQRSIERIKINEIPVHELRKSLRAAYDTLTAVSFNADLALQAMAEIDRAPIQRAILPNGQKSVISDADVRNPIIKLARRLRPIPLIN